MKKYVWEIQDGTRVPCQKDPGNQYEYYYAIGYDNTCEDVIDDEKMEATCNVKIKLRFKNKEDFELYKKNLNDIREISRWRAITK